MSLLAAVAGVERSFDEGRFFADLARRVAYKTESPKPERRAELERYLREELGPSFERLGFTWQIHDNPDPAGGPLLVARRDEGPEGPRLLTYGHGDVVPGQEARWTKGEGPWRLSADGDRWYGRGAADNKGQHSIVLAALEAVLKTRGSLGFNATALIETGEECGSPGLRAFCAANKDLLAADLFIASDGPRLTAEQPTLFLGARGCFEFELSVDLREGAHHSGNWGGLLANPAVLLSHARASLTDARGRILVEDWRPPPIPASVRRALEGLTPGGGPGAPAIDSDWGEPGLTAAEQVYGWNSFEILALEAGDPAQPVGAVLPRARAVCQLRYVVPCDPAAFLPALRRHLDKRGLTMVDVSARPGTMAATRLDPDNPWVRWAVEIMESVCAKKVALLPNLGGSLPNDAFAEVLNLPTLWVPHSYAGCQQHGADEHLLASVAREGLAIMTALFWQLGVRAQAGAGSQA
ncbi:MAG: M20 family metallopeptidase [Pseudomonadota bacterium]